jgi:hypothetical protein
VSGGVLYVYAVADSFSGGAVRGLHGAPLRAVECGPVQAIVSEHAVAPEPDEELLWAHEQVVEQLMEGAAILPMRFGNTVASPGELEAILARRQAEFAASLERVRGAVELSVRAQLPEAAAPTDVQPKLEQLASPGERQVLKDPAEHPGTAYLLERAREQRRGEEIGELVHRPLAALARRSVLKAGSGEPRAFKAAYLVDEEVVETFGERVGKLNATLGDVKLSCTGPWPPYSFVAEEPG